MKEVKRFCKGCEHDVTERMWCHCGELSLNENSTYTEAELIERDAAMDAAMEAEAKEQTMVNRNK